MLNARRGSETLASAGNSATFTTPVFTPGEPSQISRAPMRVPDWMEVRSLSSALSPIVTSSSMTQDVPMYTSAAISMRPMTSSLPSTRALANFTFEPMQTPGPMLTRSVAPMSTSLMIAPSPIFAPSACKYRLMIGEA